MVCSWGLIINRHYLSPAGLGTSMGTITPGHIQHNDMGHRRLVATVRWIHDGEKVKDLADRMAFILKTGVFEKLGRHAVGHGRTV
jgi:hypothetical protein